MEKTSLLKTERQAGIDLLRLIAVMMIATVHFLGQGILYNTEFGSFNTKAARIIESLAIVCVNLFILISGYFGITGKGLNIRRLLDMILMIAFFSGGSYIYYSAVGQNTFHFIDFGKSLIPYMFEGYWFIRVYLILSVLAPFINIGLLRLSKKSYTILLLICFICFSVLPSVSDTFKNNDGYDILHFVYIYVIGGYIRLHLPKKPRPVYCFLGYLFCSGVTFLCSVYGDGLRYWAYDFISVVPAAVLLFLAFSQLTFSSKPISYIARSSLAIFVVENSIQGLYVNILKVREYMNSPFFLLHYAVCIIGFTAFAIGVDCLRRVLFRFTVDKLIDRSPLCNKRVFVNLTDE